MENEEEFDVDTSTSEDTFDTGEDTTTDENDVDVEALKADIDRKANALRQVTARAKKAEEELKVLKTKGSTEAKPASQSESIEEIVLKANGMSDDLLRELKAVAQVRGVSLLEAQKDSIFLGIKEKQEQEQKTKEASMGASRGSGRAKVEKSFNTPNLTADEHKALWLSKRK